MELATCPMVCVSLVVWLKVVESVWRLSTHSERGEDLGGSSDESVTHGDFVGLHSSLLFNRRHRFGAGVETL